MTDASEKKPGAGSRKRPLAIIGLIGCMAAIYLMFGNGRNDGTPEPASAVENAGGDALPDNVTKELSRGAVAGFLVRSERPVAPAIAFADAAGKARVLTEWQGRVVLLNLWATWCGPCREEMPQLARLQSELGSPDFEVVALSLDRGGADVAVDFLNKIGAKALELYVDPTGKALHQFAAPGLPATILIDRRGREIGRLFGPARWASPEAIRLIRTAINEAPPTG